MNARRQPLEAKVRAHANWMRSWWPADSVRLRKFAKRRSAKRVRQQAKTEMEDSIQSC